MENHIIDFIKQYSRGFVLTNETIDELKKHLAVAEYAKNQFLLKENQRHDFAYFIINGAARSYYLKDGTEVNTWFAFENDLVGSLNTYHGLPSRETVELLEDAKLISINV
jgi:CRP-like cAMP-binding protein